MGSYDISVRELLTKTVSVPSGSWMEVFRSAASSDNAGAIEIVFAYVTFAGNNTGDRGLTLRATSADVAAVVVLAPAASGVSCRLHSSWVVTSSAASTVGVAVFQSSGVDLSASIRVREIRLTPRAN